jgi:tRNA(Glu) U13 pseudouridine synthase TruD
MEATEQAAIAITTRENERRDINRFDWMMELKSMCGYYMTKGNKLKRKFFDDRDNGESDEALKELREQGKHMKKMVKHYLKQYDELKKEMGYDSSESSDNSLLILI